MPPKSSQHDLAAYTHNDKSRINNTTAGLAGNDTQPEPLTTYTIDPNDSPSLNWAGKSNASSFTVPTISIHRHETITPLRVINPTLIEDRQRYLFPDLSPQDILNEQLRAVEVYQHSETWQNRMIAGDSLIIMNSLLRKENMAGSVQMVYVDPPYGIKYGSNFQPFVGKRDVKDRSDNDLTSEPEMIKAFRDTWELGIHSYLTYLRNRLYLARELLCEKGSVFVQISDDNVHHVREICDEIFGYENFISLIAFRTAMTKPSKGLNNVFDYIVWYAKDKREYKYHPLFKDKEIYFPEQILGEYDENEEDGTTTTQLEASAPQTKFEFTYKGITYNPPNGWRVTKESLQRLADAGRLYQSKPTKTRRGTLRYLRYISDFPYQQLDNFWDEQLSEQCKLYAVQTSTKVISRCILMTTDPGDLVLDITCGSGTTAYCAEQWGRRWITCDTSRVAIAIARQRLLTASFDYYRLADPEKGISSGFAYKSVPHITLKSIANNEPPSREILYDQPEKDSGKIRVTGTFTVESLPSPSVLTPEEASSLDPDEESRQEVFIDQLLATGIKGRNGERIKFSRIDKISGSRLINAEAWTDEDNPQMAVVCFADSSTIMDGRRVSLSFMEARNTRPDAKMVIFCAFQFDSEAQDRINTLNWPGVKLFQVEMNDDLMTEDLKRKINTDESFWLVGQPDIELVKGKDGKLRVKVLGYDYYSIEKGELISGNSDKIAMWMLDPNYDNTTFKPSQIFFPLEGKSGGWSRLRNTLKAEIDGELIGAYSGTESLPFSADEGQKIAVKIIDDRGIESMRVLTAEDAE